MAMPLRALIVEDSEDDAALVVRELSRGGFQVLHERVDSGAAMKAAWQEDLYLRHESFRVDRFAEVAIETGRQYPVAVAHHRQRGYRQQRQRAKFGLRANARSHLKPSKVWKLDVANR